jgi:hypothetical protein
MWNSLGRRGDTPGAPDRCMMIQMWGKFKWSSGLPASTLFFQHPSGYHLKQPTFSKPFSYLQDPHSLQGSTSIFLELSATFSITISNNHCLPLQFSDLQGLPSNNRIFLETSSAFSIFHYHSVTFRLFLPLPRSTSICIFLPKSIGNIQYLPIPLSNLVFQIENLGPFS